MEPIAQGGIVEAKQCSLEAGWWSPTAPIGTVQILVEQLVAGFLSPVVPWLEASAEVKDPRIARHFLDRGSVEVAGRQAGSLQESGVDLPAWVELAPPVVEDSVEHILVAEANAVTETGDKVRRRTRNLVATPFCDIDQHHS